MKKQHNIKKMKLSTTFNAPSTPPTRTQTRRGTHAAPRVTHTTRPAPPPSPTCHSHGARLIRRAPDPQLPEVVPAPAHDPATRHDGARVGNPSGDGGGEEAWEEGEEGCECRRVVERVAGVAGGGWGWLDLAHRTRNHTTGLTWTPHKHHENVNRR